MKKVTLVLTVISSFVLLTAVSTIATASTQPGGLEATTLSASTFKVRSREQIVDETTSALTFQLYPDLKYSVERIREMPEWSIIREIIDERGLAYQELNPRANDSNWYWKYDDEGLKEALADAIFYYRHPERQGSPIQRHEHEAIREWNELKRAMWFPTN